MLIWRDNKTGGTAEYHGKPIFTLATENLIFKDMVLRPEGEPMLNGLFGFRENSHGEPVHVDACQVEAQPDRFKFSFRTRSRVNPSLKNAIAVTVTYDAAKNRFVYHVAITLDVTDEGYNGLFPREIEFFNIWPRNMHDDIRIPGRFDDAIAWKEEEKYWQETRYRQIVYESKKGTFLVPINQYIHSLSQKKPVKALGRLAYVNHPAGNPTIRLLPGASVPVIADRCHLCHDEHMLGVLGEHNNIDFRRKYNAGMRQHYDFFKEIPVGLQARMEFEFYDSYGPESDEMIASSRKQRLPKKDLARLLPVRQLDSCGYDSFETPHRMDEAENGDFWVPVSGWEKPSTDWFWASPPRRILEQRCIWERKYGRTGTACLKIVTEADLRAGWESLDQAIFLRPGSRCLLTIHVRTLNLVGKGAFLGYYFAQDVSARGAGKPFTIRSSSPGLTGTRDWTKLQLSFTAPEAESHEHCISALYIRFWHEGLGTSWWDDLSLISMDEELHPSLPYRKIWQQLPRQVEAYARCKEQ